MRVELNNVLKSNIKLVKSIFSSKNMPTLVIILAILLILYYVYTTYLKEGFESVDLEEEIKKGNTLVLFYADWCGHCKKIKPIWKEAEDEIDEDEDKKMIKINCGDKKKEHQAIAEKYNIDGYPTIILFKDGKPTQYKGPRTKDGFIEALS
jgi:thiol-disulfide isomerase/thioredoxin